MLANAANGDYLAKLGYRLHPDGEFLFSRKFSKVYPEDRIVIQREFLKIKSGADFSESTFRVEKTDGSYGWLNLKLHAYLNQAGDREVYGICTDIDQQVRDKLAVQSAYTQLERTITSLPGGGGERSPFGALRRGLGYDDGNGSARIRNCRPA